VVDDGHQPTANVAALASVGRGATPGGDVRIVNDVLRRLALAEDPVRERVGQAAVAVIERREGSQIALGERDDDDVVRLVGGVRHCDDCTDGVQGRMRRQKASRANCSVPCHCIDAQQLAVEPILDILSDPLMLSPVALPGTGALDGISDRSL